MAENRKRIPHLIAIGKAKNLVSTLEQYLAIRKAGMTEAQLKAAEALKDQMKIEKVVVRMHLPDANSENE